MLKHSQSNKIQRFTFYLFLGVIFCIILFLFWDDISLLFIKVGVSTHLVQIKDVQAFQVKEGYIEYVSGVNKLEVYPDLPSVNATLSIQRVSIEGGIVEGKDETAMNKGFWHFPSASPFASKGNVVIIGHRYLHLPPRKDTFYNLDKVVVGDIVTLATNQQTFKYRVRMTAVVDVTETSILEQTENAQLTVITCHPLWTSRERLVIIADRI